MTAIRRSRLSIVDALSEAVYSLAARPGRSLLNMCAMALGVASCVATLTLTDTVRHQVSDQFDLLRATEVTVKDLRPDLPAAPFTGDTEARVGRVAGVQHAGVIASISEQARLSSAPAFTPGAAATDGAIVAMSPGGFAATRSIVSGQPPGWFHERQRALVAVVGRQIAEGLQLGSQPRPDQAIYVGGVPLTILGVLEASPRRPELLNALVVPYSLGSELWAEEGKPRNLELIVDVAPGAAEQAGRQLPAAIDPTQADRYQPVVPPDPARLRRRVETDVAGLFLGVGLVGLVAGALAIANTTAVSVMQRRGELALRRALGARTLHVIAHVLTDAVVLGVLGGLFGAVMGALGTVGVSLTRHWAPVVDLRLLIVAPLVGGLLGLLGGIYPAGLAASVEPAVALRQ